MKISLPEESDLSSKDAVVPKIEDKRKTTKDSGNVSDLMDEADFPHYKRVSDYLLGTCVGEGSFAKVRVGFHCPTREKVAVKIINKAKARRDSYVYKNLHREGRLLQMLRHPNIVQVFDILETGNNYYLVTELCNGGELIDIVTEEGSLSEETVCTYMKQLVDAVAYMQDRRIVHRDLKVENLLLDSEGNLKIIDFGLSNIIAERSGDLSNSLATQCGSPAYAAPELLAKKSYGPKVDVWSIGVITYALLVGKLPFTVDPFSIPKLCKKMLRGEMNHIPPFVSSACRVFIRKLLTPDHSHRPSIREVAKLKWLSMFTAPSSHASAKSSITGFFIDSVEKEMNVRRRHNFLAPLFHPPIDSSVVRDMGSSFGFASSEVIQSVQKNRPGPALATYHLLSKKRTWRKSKTITETQGERKLSAKVTQKGEGKSSSNLNEDALKESDGTNSNKHLQRTLQLPNKKSSQSSLNSPEKRPAKPTLSNISKNEKENKPISTENVDLNANSTKQHPQTPKKLTTIPNYFNSTRPISDINHKKSIGNDRAEVEQHLEENKTKTAVTAQTDHSRGSKPVNTIMINPKSQASDVKDMLTNMRKARQVLAKKQQLNQQQKRLNVTSFDQPAQINQTKNKAKEATAIKPIDVETSLPQTSVKIPRSAQKVFHQLISEQRSSSQQASRASIEHNSYNTKQSPYKRPVSHNSVLPEKSDNAIVHNRLIRTPGSPQHWRRSTELSHATEKNKQEVNNSPSPTRPNVVTLPRIYPKPVHRTERHSQPQQKLSASSNMRPIRRSLPPSYAHYSGNHRLTLQSTTSSKTETVRKYNQKKADTKTTVISKWQKSPSKDGNQNLKPQFNYYISNTAGDSPSHRQRPKKVISEPIAAAISYLTSTKHRAFRKEKPPSITTG